MANAQPTRRTFHMDIKHFAFFDWVEQDLLCNDKDPHNSHAKCFTIILTHTWAECFQLTYSFFTLHMSCTLPTPVFPHYVGWLRKVGECIYIYT